MRVMTNGRRNGAHRRRNRAIPVYVVGAIIMAIIIAVAVVAFLTNGKW
jgi:hypothetical protein